MIEHGYLLLADISGYTPFLATTELDHAQSILSDLLELILATLKPALPLSQVQGDSIFAYSPDSQLLRGETILDLVEATYSAFRDRLVAMQRRTTCNCNACKSLTTLDLKFLVHYGEYLTHQIAGTDDLLGKDVSLVAQRQLKTHMADIGSRGYAVFTADSLQHMGLQAKGMQEQIQRHKDFGDIKTYVMNLQAYYQAAIDTRRVFVDAEQADGIISVECPAAPAVVWDWLNMLEKRTLWINETRWTPGSRPWGRSGIGAQNHCVHGKVVALETILDWRPFEYYTSQIAQSNVPVKLRVTYQLVPISSGTRLNVHIKLDTALPKWSRRLMFQVMDKVSHMRESHRKLAALITQEASSKPSAKASVSAQDKITA